MPEGFDDNEFPSEKAQTFEEAKRALEEKDAAKQAEEKQDFDEAKDYFNAEAKEARLLGSTAEAACAESSVV